MNVSKDCSDGSTFASWWLCSPHTSGQVVDEITVDSIAGVVRNQHCADNFEGF
jgi:hypothetical protein